MAVALPRQEDVRSVILWQVENYSVWFFLKDRPVRISSWQFSKPLALCRFSKKATQNWELISKYFISGCWLVKRKQRDNWELICPFALTEISRYLTRTRNRKNRDKTEEADNDPHGLSLNKENKECVCSLRNKFKDTCKSSITTPVLYKQERHGRFQGRLSPATDHHWLQVPDRRYAFNVEIHHPTPTIKIRMTKSLLLLYEIPLAVVFKYDRKFLQSIISSVGGSQTCFVCRWSDASQRN